MRNALELYFLFLLLQSCIAQKNSKANGKGEKKENEKNGKMNVNKSTTFISSYISTHRPSAVPSIATPPSRFPSMHPTSFPSKPPTIASDNETPAFLAESMEPTISPSNAPTITSKTSKPISVDPSMAPISKARTHVPSNQFFSSESSVPAQFLSMTPSDQRSEPICPQASELNESKQSSTERTSSPIPVVNQPSTTVQIASSALSTKRSSPNMNPSAAARPFFPKVYTRLSIQSPSKRIRRPLKRPIIPNGFLREKGHQKPPLSYSSTGSTIHQSSKSPSVSPSPSLILYTSPYLSPEPSSNLTLYLSSSTHYPEQGPPTVSKLSPTQSPRLLPNASSSTSPSPPSSMSPSPSASMSPKVTSNHEATNVNQYIIINIYLTSMAENQRREELRTRVERHLPPDTNYCPSKYKEMTGYISAANVRMNGTFDEIIAIIASIIIEGTKHQVEGVNILRSHANTSNSQIGYSHRRNLFSQFLILDLSDPLLIVEDMSCWVHMRLPFCFTSTHDTLENNSTLSNNGGSFTNQTSPIPYRSMQYIRVKALQAVEKSAMDGSFIERLHLNELVIRNVSFDLLEDFSCINCEHQSKSSSIFWQPIRMTGIALFLSTFFLTVILINVAKKRSQQQDSRRISSPPRISECQSKTF